LQPGFKGLSGQTSPTEEMFFELPGNCNAFDFIPQKTSGQLGFSVTFQNGAFRWPVWVVQIPVFFA
jgi:hypothetical protein